MEDGTRRLHEFGPENITGEFEFEFVPRSLDAREDDGWLVGLVIDAGGHTTALEILDARSFEAPPAASVHIPHRVPPGIHGAWLK